MLTNTTKHIKQASAMSKASSEITGIEIAASGRGDEIPRPSQPTEQLDST